MVQKVDNDRDHLLIGGLRYRPYAKGSIVCEGDEICVLYEVKLPEYDYF